MSYQIIALPEDVSAHVRETRTDPIYGYEYDVMPSKAGPKGYGPCRQCLSKFSEHESRLLFLYNPFSRDQGDFAGPVFIHEHECEPHSPSGRFPDELRDLPIALRAYTEEGHFVRELLPGRNDIDSKLESLFDDPSVAEIHVRNTKARCFIAKAIRVNGTRQNCDSVL